MSIYRKHHRGPYGAPAVDPLEPNEGAKSPQESPPTTPLDVPEARLRRQAPNDNPLSPTFKWIAKLPSGVQPLNLLRRYPRIANSLAGAWNDPQSFRAHVDDLLIDRRRGRQGFTAEILGELLALRAYYESLHPELLDVYKETGKRT